jgi:deoxyribodipyrimidine photo-lyase
VLNVVWFRRDLRVDDHAPLLGAVAGGGIVLPLYVVEPGYWSRPVASARQWRFVARALAALRAQLAVLGAPLVVRTGEAVEVLEAIRAGGRGFALWSHADGGDAWSLARDGRVAEWALAQGVEWHRPPSVDIVRRGTSNDPGRLWAQRMAEASLPPPQAMMAHGMPPGRIVSERVIGLPEDSCAEQPAGPQPARRLLDAFLAERAGRYRAGRAAPGLAAEACSHLSPHLAWGTVSAREVAQAALAARDGCAPDARRGVGSFLWRLRLRARLMQRLEDEPSIEHRCIDTGLEGLRAGGDAASLDAWAAGRTGFPLVDAGLRELAATGWLGCRMRALCASVAAHQLWLDWRAFGPVLARLCTDFEPGVHWFHCQAQSGVAGRGWRVMDPVAESARLDPDGGYIRQWVPELARVPARLIHRPWRMSALEQAETGCRVGIDYPAPLVDAEAAAQAALARIAAAGVPAGLALCTAGKAPTGVGLI